MMRVYFLLVSIILLFSFGQVSSKKKISDKNFRYEFYTTTDVVTPKPDRQYFWFKGGAIHSSDYGVAGELLHNAFLKFYHSNQLAEGGTYKRGLKEGWWKNWHENGELQLHVYWNKGQKDGRYYAYDKTGLLTEEGKYKRDKKHGRWINYISGDTLKYKNGKVVIKKQKDTLLIKKQGLLKRIFFKKKRDTLAQPQTKRPGLLKRLFKTNRKDSLQVLQTNLQDTDTVKKQRKSFLKRIFSGGKKVKRQEANNLNNNNE